MPDMRLQDYTAKIKDLIRNVRLEEAIAHGQHILRQYPKHIETYCLLGEACLEKELYREAIEFFQRALSADPESLISRVGLGVIYDEQGALPEAIWQLERAFELAPGNAEVRRELQRLYAQHDGAERPRLRLTRGALGRLYSSNGLYGRAIGEFFAVLRQDPDLPDVRVALAEALWREGRKLDAVEVCQELVEALPNCLKANLILGEVWTQGENEEEGRERLKLVREMDPENLLAQEMMGRNSPLPLEEVFVSELEAVPDRLDFGPDEWELGGAETVAIAGEIPLPETAEPGEREEDLPDWLRDMGMVAEEELAMELESEESALAEAHPEEVISVEEMPEWLQEVFEESEGEEIAVPPVEEALPESALATGLAVAAAHAIAQDDLDSTVAETPTVELEVEQAEEIPEWLQELVDEEPPSVAEEAVPEPEEEAVEVAPEAEVADEEPPFVEEAPAIEEEVVAEEVRAWEPEEAPVSELAEEAPSVEMAPAVEETMDAEEMPDWLRDLGVPEAEEVEPPFVAEVAEGEPPSVEEGVDAEEMPAWLRDLEMPEEEELGPPSVVKETEEVAPIVEDAVDAEEMPAWVADLETPAAEEFGPPPVLEVAEGEPPSEEEVAADSEVPASLLALVEAGLLEESDLESAMSGMSHEELEAQRAEEVPPWLQELMDNGVTPVLDDSTPVGDARLVRHDLAHMEREEVVLPIVEAPAEEVVLPIVEAPFTEAPSAEEVALPIVEAPLEEEPVAEKFTPPVEEVALPIVEAPLEEGPPAEETALPIVKVPVEDFAPPVEEVALVEEEIGALSRVDELLERLKAKPRDYQARLELARLYGEERDWTAALAHYEKLISARKLLPEALNDLEALAEEDVERPRVYQLLGDAYMQQDQLDKALEMYRLARKSLTKR